jgi:hypothetical protein
MIIQLIAWFASGLSVAGSSIVSFQYHFGKGFPNKSSTLMLSLNPAVAAVSSRLQAK